MTAWRNRPKWAKPLNAAEWRHLCYTTSGPRPTRESLKRNREHQIPKEDGETDKCYECRHIAIKLGLESCTDTVPE